MQRHFAPRTFAALLAGLFTIQNARVPLHAAGLEHRLNIVLITVDTLRFDRVGAYGHRAAATPNMDALARRGVRFDQAMAHTPLTFPSHATILTGQLPLTHGARDNGSQVLGGNVGTVAERLKAEGYRTAAFVSSFILNAQFGLDRGFDVYDDRLPIGGPIIDYELRRSGAQTAAAAEAWIGDHASAPFFAWVHLYDPHSPYAGGASARDPYDAGVSASDAGVGQVLAALARAGVADRTAVILTADHGEGLGDHGEAQHGLLLYDSVVHVPLIVAAPGLAPAVVSTQVRHIDIAPTVFSFAGVTATGLPGRNLRDLVTNRPREGNNDEAYGESWYGRIHFGWSDIRFLRVDQWKFIDGPEPELFDLAHDPRESVNLASARPELAASMKKRLATLTDARQKPLTTRQPDSATLERLRSLGYVGGSEDSAIRLGSVGADPKRMLPAFEAYTAVMRAGIADLAGNRPVRAVDRFRVLARGYPDSYEAHHYFGYALSASHRDADAVAEYQRALALNPGYAVAYFDLAKALAAIGRPADARASLHAGLWLEPRSTYGAMTLGIVAWAHGDNVTARAAFERAVDLSPQEPRGYANLGEACMRLSDLDCAQRAFGQLVALGFAPAAAHFNLGVIAERRGRPLDAVSEYRAALAGDPHLEQARQAIQKLKSSQ